MEYIDSLLAITISEFKQNLEKVVEEARGKPLAVLDGDRPAFYVVPPEMMAAMADLYDERQLGALVQSRLKSTSLAVKVDLEDLP